jgi:hypothetical protein
MGKKKTKKKILRKIEERLERNRYFCVYNGCGPSEYMEGVNEFAKDLRKFIKRKC